MHSNLTFIKNETDILNSSHHCCEFKTPLPAPNPPILLDTQTSPFQTHQHEFLALKLASQKASHNGAYTMKMSIILLNSKPLW